jgi:hypothetical protein
MAPVLTPKESDETVPTSIRFPKKLLEEIDRAGASLGLNRTETILQLARWALDAHWREAGQKAKK